MSTRLAKAMMLCLQVMTLRAALSFGTTRAADPEIVCGVADPVSCARSLMANRQWQALVDAFPASSEYPAELYFHRGMALAHLGRLQESRQAFESGRIKAPSDKRFYLELAGIAFKLGDAAQSRRLLRTALKADPLDLYGNDFLATLYFLQGNLEAALKYWNRVGKPVIESVKPDPVSRVDPVLLDHCFAFSPASLLTPAELRSTKARLDLMNIFSGYRFELEPRQDGAFNLLFHSLEREGWRSSVSSKLISSFTEIPYQTVHVDVFDLRGSASNLQSFYRWDAQRRRAFVSFSSPVMGDPGRRWRLWLDGRNENWDVSGSLLSGTSGFFKLRKLELGAGIGSVIRDSWEWKSEVSVAARQFFGTSVRNSTSSGLFADGLALKYGAHVSRQLVDQPEKRLKAQSFASIQLSSMMTGSHNRYVKLNWGLGLDWLPKARGEDYHLSGRLRAGGILGKPPLDELYSLGIERDNDLYMRGHAGTLGAMKGAGPLGRRFFLLNFEMDKIVHDGGFWRFSLGPFLDSGRAYDASGEFGSRGWLWDAGVQSKIVILHSFNFVFSYGWDLRSAKSAFYSGTGSPR